MLLKGAGFRAIETMEKTLVEASYNRDKLNRYHQKYPTGSYATLVSELEGELSYAFDTFLEGYFPYQLFGRLDATMKAFGYRIEKAFLSTVQYRKSEELLLAHQNRVVAFIEQAHTMSPADEQKLIRYMFLVEEYGIMLFAHPHVKTAEPISEKRLMRLVEELGGE